MSCFRWISNPPTMGIGTSSSSSGASAPRANAYAVNRDASELGRSPARKAPASAQPGPMHVIYMSVRGSCFVACRAAGHGQRPHKPLSWANRSDACLSTTRSRARLRHEWSLCRARVSRCLVILVLAFVAVSIVFLQVASRLGANFGIPAEASRPSRSSRSISGDLHLCACYAAATVAPVQVELVEQEVVRMDDRDVVPGWGAGMGMAAGLRAAGLVSAARCTQGWQCCGR